MATKRRASPPTRQSFSESLSRWAEDPPLSVVLIDIDYFKEVNDRYGHEIGDKVIDRIAETLGAAIGPEMVTRTGGDEFACVLPATTPERALISIENIRTTLSSKPIIAGRNRIPISISAGIASLPQHAEDPSQLVSAADEALHRSKREGKGRVSIWVEDKMVLKSNYYSRAQLGGLAQLAQRLGQTEASLLREALGHLLERYRDAG